VLCAKTFRTQAIRVVRILEQLGRLSCAKSNDSGYAREDPRIKPILSQVARGDSNPQVQEAAAEMLQNVE